MKNQKILIIGGGVIGLGIGWQLAKAGAAVTIYESGQAGRGASWAAAGMLGPIAEAHSDELTLLELSNQSLARYPEWADELETETGMSIGYRSEGTLIIGIGSDETDQLRHTYAFQQELGLNVEWLSGQEAREIEGALSPYVTAAIRCETDHQVDNRLMAQALQCAYQKQGGVLYQNSSVERLVIENGTATGVETQEGFQGADVCILAAGLLVWTDSRVTGYDYPARASREGPDVGVTNAGGSSDRKRYPHRQDAVSDTGIFSAENRW